MLHGTQKRSAPPGHVGRIPTRADSRAAGGAPQGQALPPPKHRRTVTTRQHPSMRRAPLLIAPTMEVPMLRTVRFLTVVLLCSPSPLLAQHPEHAAAAAKTGMTDAQKIASAM